MGEAIEQWIDRLQWYDEMLASRQAFSTDDPVLWIVRFEDEASLGSTIDLNQDWADMLDELASVLGLESSGDIPKDTHKLLSSITAFDKEFDRFYGIWDRHKQDAEESIADGSAYLFTVIEESRESIQESITYLESVM